MSIAMAPAIIGRPETVAQLFPGDSMGRLVRGMTEALDKSFSDEHGKMRGDITQEEIKTRFALLLKWAKILRGDQSWGLERIVGQFGEILICYMARKDYEPPARKC